MDWWTGILSFFVMLGAGFVQRVSGFGLGIFAMIFLPYGMPAQAASAMSSIVSCVATGSNSVRYRKDIRFRIALPMVCAALLTIPLAVYFSARVSGDLFQILLGSILVLLSLFFLLLQKRISMKPTMLNGVIAGALGGTLGGLFSTGGPPAVLYLTNATDSKLSYFATIQFYFLLTNLYTTATRAFHGMITRQVLLCSAVGIMGSLAGDALGKLVFDKLDGNKLKRIIYIGMIVSGLLMIFRI